MERDPHQLIEGILHRLLRRRRRPGLPLRAGRDGARPGAHRPGPQRRLRRGLRRHGTSSAPTSPSTSCSLGRRRLHRRRGDGADREPRGQPGHAPAQAAVLPGRQGPVPAADDRQQRRDAVEPAVDHHQRRRRLRRPRRADVHRACACSRCRATSNQPGVYEVERRHDVPRADRRARVLRRHPRRPQAEGVHPRRRVGAVVLRGAPRPAARQADGRQGRLDARLGRHRRDGRDHRHGEGVLAHRALLRPRVAAASARRAARARPGSSRSCSASSTATAGPSDLDLLLDVCDNISPGIAWPPRQTTICPLGPSAVSPIASAVTRFRDEFEHYIDARPSRRRRRRHRSRKPVHV